MASQGPNNPNTFDGNSDWDSNSTSPSNVGGSDDVYARHTNIFTPNKTSLLEVTNFGFSIPSNATIDGISVEVERNEVSFGDAVDDEVRIIKGGVLGSVNKADSVTIWPSTDVAVSYGGVSDLWGESWTHSDINSTNFGVAVSAISNSGLSTCQIDNINATVYFTVFDGLRVSQQYVTVLSNRESPLAKSRRNTSLSMIYRLMGIFWG